MKRRGSLNNLIQPTNGVMLAGCIAPGTDFPWSENQGVRLSANAANPPPESFGAANLSFGENSRSAGFLAAQNQVIEKNHPGIDKRAVAPEPYSSP